MRIAHAVTFAATLAGTLALGGARAHADYHYTVPTSTFTDSRTDRCARKGGDNCADGDGDVNIVLAPDGKLETAHTPPTLLLFLPGHGGSPADYHDFLTAAVHKGYYVIGLAFRNGQSIQGLCGYWADCPDFLFAQIVDKNTNNGFFASQQSAQPADHNSINFRLGALLSYLKAQGIANGFDWKQFYDYGNSNVAWSKLVIAGHSMGGATATWITKNKPVIGGIVFESPYTTLYNSNGGVPNVAGSTPCTASSCPFSSSGGPGHASNSSFASYLRNDSSNWANKLWMTLSAYDSGYDDESNPGISCSPGDDALCGSGACVGGSCTIPIWPGLNMQGAGDALGKSEQFFYLAPTSLGSHKWWTTLERPAPGCTGHGSTVNDGCYTSHMPAYWDLVLDAVLPVIFLEGWARALVVLHAAAAIVLIGAATHHGLVVRALPWNARFNVRLSRVYAPVCAIAFLATTALGALAYPTYRYYVRGQFLDRHALWASRLFDIKEDLAVVGALAAIGVWILSRAVDGKSDRVQRSIYAALVWVVPAVVWFDVFSGLVITMVRSV